MTNVKRELMSETMSTLRMIAKNKNIVGRWDMKKETLVDAILESDRLGLEHEQDPKDELVEVDFTEDFDEPCQTDEDPIEQLFDTKAKYRKNAEIGTLIAFRIGPKLMTAMIKEIHHNDLIVETRKGSKFTVNKDHVEWFKTGNRWPKHIYRELKGLSDGKVNG